MDANSEGMCVNAAFLNGSRWTVPYPCRISPDLLKAKVSYCREVFAESLQSEFGFRADIESIVFWKPRIPFLCADVAKVGWIEIVGKVGNFAERVPFNISLSEAVGGLETVKNRRLLHLFMTADGELGDFFTRARNRFPLPVNYSYREREIVYDGRYRFRSECFPTAAPIQIFHPVFERFICKVEDPNVQLSSRVVRQSLDLLYTASKIIRSQTQRAIEQGELLSQILGIELELGEGATSSEGAISLCHREVLIVVMYLELKQEVGGCGVDPSIEAQRSMKKFWTENNMAVIRNRCCCPTLLLAAAGPWVAILGGVFTDKFIVQRLTDMMWIGHNSIREDARIIRLARVLQALRDCIHELQDFYREIIDATSENTATSANQLYPDSGLHPYPKHFIMEDGRLVSFEYLGALEDHPKCLAYRARMLDGRDIVVKFVSRYSMDVHTFLASLGYAPQLLYYGAIPNYPSWPTKGAEERRLLPLMQMVVMEYIERGTVDPDPVLAREKILDALSKLHAAGFVLGDLREPNVLFDKDHNLKLIDFDWAGRYNRDSQDHDMETTDMETVDDVYKDRYDYAHYPVGLSKSIDWADGVRELAPILRKCDLGMLDKLYPPEF